MKLIVLWDGDMIFDEIAMELDIPAINVSLVDKSTEEIEAKQVVIEQQVQLALAKRQEALELIVRNHIGSFAKGVVKKPQMNQNMAVNLSVLLPESAQVSLGVALERINEDTNSRYTVSCAGPLPPHSFARLTVRAPKPEMIEHARELLGLGFEATLQEIKEAYHNHAYYMHPDRNSDLDSIVKMTELAQSYKLLKELAVGQGGAVCRMDTSTVSESVLMTVQRLGR